jgi:hypothetical protein
MIALMQAFERRALSSGEIALGQSVFGDAIDWTRVRVLQLPPLPGLAAVVPHERTIVFSRWRAARDFAAAPKAEQGWFVHELAHVWQARRGVVLAFAKLGALGAGAYRYDAAPGAALADYNIEQQAEIARHVFLARAGAGASGAPPRGWLEAIWKGSGA